MPAEEKKSEPLPQSPDRIDITPLRINWFELATGLYAEWRINPNNQQKPADGDYLKVLAEVVLPLEGGTKFLDARLIFCNRLTLFARPLDEKWGTYASRTASEQWGPGRYENHEFIGKTWRTALEAAAAYCIDELNKLKNALAVRAEFLHSDGWDLVCLAKDVERSGQTMQPAPKEEPDIPF